MIAAGILVAISLSPVRGPGPRASRINAICETWGRRVRIAVLVCGEHEDYWATISAISNANNPAIEAWELPARDHSPRFSQFKAMKFSIERAAREKVDWMLWANDHTFLVVENLACYLRTLNASQIVYAGSRLWGPCCGIFNSGAAGFVLSRKALDALDRHWDSVKPMKNCDPENKRAHIATCLHALAPSVGQPIDTRDEDGADIFQVYGPVRLATGAVDEWFLTKKKHVDNSQPLRGVSSVSSHVVSFHYVAGSEARVLDAFLHEPTFSSLENMKDMGRRWPKSPAELGGYAYAWPGDPVKERQVATLLDKIQLCKSRT